MDDTIYRARSAFVAALNGGDAIAASALYADDARLLAPSAELFEGREAIAAFWHAGLEAGIAKVELEELNVERNESVAWEIGRYALRLDHIEGGTVVDRGKYLLVHVRQPDGCWRRAAEMFSPDRPPAAAGERPQPKQEEARS